MKPFELEEAELITALCERFSCLPSALMREDARLLGLLAIAAEGKREE